MIRITIEAGDKKLRSVVVTDEEASEHSSCDVYANLIAQALKGFGFHEETVKDYIQSDS